MEFSVRPRRGAWVGGSKEREKEDNPYLVDPRAGAYRHEMISRHRILVTGVTSFPRARVLGLMSC